MTAESATHADPVWREKADFLISADLTSAGMPGEWEQLWAKRLREGEFLVCCIPYFTYGVALGDTVRTAPAGERTYVIEAVVARSGRRVLRLWLRDAGADARSRVIEYIAKESLLHEWSSANLLVIDVAADCPAAGLLEAVMDDAIQFEWGETLPNIDAFDD